MFMALIAVVFAALGTAIGSTLRDMQGFQLIMNFLIMPIFFLSGALFPLDNLPTALTVATRLDPLAYGVDGLRGAFIGVSHIGVLLDVSVLAVLVGAIPRARRLGVLEDPGLGASSTGRSLRSRERRGGALLVEVAADRIQRRAVGRDDGFVAR